MAGPLSGIGAQQTNFTQFQPGGTSAQQQARERVDNAGQQPQQAQQQTQPTGTRAAQGQQTNQTQSTTAAQTTPEGRVADASSSSARDGGEGRGSILDITV